MEAVTMEAVAVEEAPAASLKEGIAETHPLAGVGHGTKEWVRGKGEGDCQSRLPRDQ